MGEEWMKGSIIAVLLSPPLLAAAARGAGVALSSGSGGGDAPAGGGGGSEGKRAAYLDGQRPPRPWKKGGFAFPIGISYNTGNIYIVKNVRVRPSI
jgi:hypothetical protein